jgi:hypothetical protein
MFAAMAATVSAGDMRCGNDIVNIKDSSFTVAQKCGDPVSKVHVGYTINKNKKRELVIEEWIYGPKNDYYYFVTMVGGRVSEIQSERK